MKIKQFSCHSFFPMIHGVVVATIYFLPPPPHNAPPFFFPSLCCLSPLQRSNRHWATSSGGREAKERRRRRKKKNWPFVCGSELFQFIRLRSSAFRKRTQNAGAIVACSDEGAKSSGAPRHRERKSFPYPYPRWQPSGWSAWSGLRSYGVQCIPRPRLAHSTIRITARLRSINMY